MHMCIVVKIAPAPAFGAPAPAPSMFGGAPAPVGGLFGGQPAGGAPQGGGTKHTPYQPTNRQDGTSSISMQTITAMAAYGEKSLEELRYEDYAQGNKGTGNSAGGAGGFGASGGFAAAPAGGFQSANTFGKPATGTYIVLLRGIDRKKKLKAVPVTNKLQFHNPHHPQALFSVEVPQHRLQQALDLEQHRLLQEVSIKM